MSYYLKSYAISKNDRRNSMVKFVKQLFFANQSLCDNENTHVQHVVSFPLCVIAKNKTNP